MGRGGGATWASSTAAVFWALMGSLWGSGGRVFSGSACGSGGCEGGTVFAC